MHVTIRRGDGKSGAIATILDDMDRHLTGTMPTIEEQCIRAVQEEVVARCPVLTGNLKENFSSADAIGRSKDSIWLFGLLTKAAQKAAFYWKFVEYGTKGGEAHKRGEMGARGRRFRKTSAARKPRPAHPFMRPGILAARARFRGVIVNLAGVALDNWRKGK
jgi:HK97 gp10 family phage protein